MNLQPSDADILKAFQTFYNGCNFTLRVGERIEVEFGCYGVHVNLAQGAKRRLMEWLVDNNGRAELRVLPETLNELISRKPCNRCGGFMFKEKVTEGENL